MIPLRFPLPVFLASAAALLAGPPALRAQSSASASGPAAARHFVITDFGAVAGGKVLNSAAIQSAIDQAGAAGGGVVEIPQGTFRSGSIFLKPGVALYLDEGAVLLGSNQIEDYPKRVTRIEGHFEPWRMALVNAQQMDSVRIAGQGKLDGNGIMFWAAFWQRRKENPACTNLEVERPRLMFIDRCHNVRISGVTLQNSGFWNLHLYRCHDVVVEGLSILAPSKGPILGPSTDGIDIDSSQDVTVRGCHIAVNDDNIALKGSKGPLADHDADSPPVENILIENCDFGDGNGMVTCGSEATIVRNVTVRHCRITGKTNLICLKLRPDTPQDYENITIDGVELTGGAGRLVQVAPWRQFFDLQGHAPPVQRISHVTLRNITGTFGSFGTLHGNPGDTISDITLENIDVKLTGDASLSVGKTDHLVFDNVRVNGADYAVPAPAAGP
jgi:polygalacturonase